MAVAPTTFFPGAISYIPAAGLPVVVFYAPPSGAIVTNPFSAADQGIPFAEALYVDLVNPAALGETGTTIPLQPGQSYSIPPGITTNVWVNAATTGHRFSALQTMPSPSPLTPIPASFPPTGPTSLTKTIPSYLYVEYNDDDDLQAFVSAYNSLAQDYVDTFNDLNLPIYTSDPVSGSLLDWVAQGLYGILRPTLADRAAQFIGPFNTYAFNTLGFNEGLLIGSSGSAPVNDDIFRRIITWRFYKGDGKTFNIRWLKRRVMRFLDGTNGVSYNVDTTYPVSVTFGTGNQVNINLLPGVRNITSGAFFNGMGFNTTVFNGYESTFTPYPAIPNAAILKEAIETGVLELPFQFEYIVTI